MTSAVAFSGGPDSLCSAHLLSRGYAFIVDHGLRATSGSEAETAAKQAQDLGLEPKILTWLPQETPRTQAAYRAGRYALLAQACQTHQVDELWMGHHLDDQCETLMLRLSMGSGLMGLSGMAAKTWIGNARLIRPLLGVTKDQILERLKSLGEDWISDPSNQNRAYPRVMWRAYLTENPDLKAKLSDLGRGVGGLRNQSLASIPSRAVQVMAPGVLRLDESAQDLAPSVLYELLSACVRWVGGRAFSNVSDLVHFVQKPGHSGQSVGTGGTLTSWQRKLQAFTMVPEVRAPEVEREATSDLLDRVDPSMVDMKLVQRAVPLLQRRQAESEAGLWFPGKQSRNGGLIVGEIPRFDHEFATKSTPLPWED